MRSFIAQGVDAILIAPVVASGSDAVLQAAREAEMAVVPLQRMVESAPSLYLTAAGSNLIQEGELVGKWLADTVGDKERRIAELQGISGFFLAIDRKKGSEQGIAGNESLSIVTSKTGDFTRSLGKEVVESVILAENGGRNTAALRL